MCFFVCFSIPLPPSPLSHSIPNSKLKIKLNTAAILLNTLLTQQIISALAAPMTRVPVALEPTQRARKLLGVIGSTALGQEQRVDGGRRTVVVHCDITGSVHGERDSEGHRGCEKGVSEKPSNTPPTPHPPTNPLTFPAQERRQARRRHRHLVPPLFLLYHAARSKPTRFRRRSHCVRSANRC